MGTFQVRKMKVPEGCPEVTVWEKSDELTLRDEEVGTLKTYINVNHIEEERCVHPWLIMSGMPSVMPFTKASRRCLGRK